MYHCLMYYEEKSILVFYTKNTVYILYYLNFITCKILWFITKTSKQERKKNRDTICNSLESSFWLESIFKIKIDQFPAKEQIIKERVYFKKWDIVSFVFIILSSIHDLLFFTKTFISYK